MDFLGAFAMVYSTPTKQNLESILPEDWARKEKDGLCCCSVSSFPGKPCECLARPVGQGLSWIFYIGPVAGIFWSILRCWSGCFPWVVSDQNQSVTQWPGEPTEAWLALYNCPFSAWITIATNGCLFAPDLLGVYLPLTAWSSGPRCGLQLWLSFQVVVKNQIRKIKDMGWIFLKEITKIYKANK